MPRERSPGPFVNSSPIDENGLAFLIRGTIPAKDLRSSLGSDSRDAITMAASMMHIADDTQKPIVSE
jgi:hypothetical protein